MSDHPLPPGVVALIARWVIDEAMAPTRGDESHAVASLRLTQVVRLPPDEREALMKLLLQEPADGGDDRRKGQRSWFH